MELCCSVNGDRRCTKCERSFCAIHVYQLNDYSVTTVIHKYMCYSCYAIYVRKPYIENPREGLTYAELYQIVREITPSGYLTIEVKLLDARPGIMNPELQWNIYHEKLSWVSGKTPEQALAHYKTALAIWTDKSSPIANVNI